jgi:hypothetical protein
MIPDVLQPEAENPFEQVRTPAKIVDLRHHVLRRKAGQPHIPADSGRMQLADDLDVYIPDLEIYAAR